MSTTSPELTNRQNGFSTVAAIFILVVLASLGAFVVSLTTTQNVSLAQDMQNARAYQAARAGLEWGMARWLNASSCANGSVTFTDADLSTFTATVTATATTSGGINFCTLESVAIPTGTTIATLGFVERKLSATLEAP